jgi:hypothetical protein
VCPQVPLFHDCENGFLRSVARVLTSELFPPLDPVVVAGESGQEMYFINQVKTQQSVSKM